MFRLMVLRFRINPSTFGALWGLQLLELGCLLIGRSARHLAFLIHGGGFVRDPSVILKGRSLDDSGHLGGLEGAVRFHKLKASVLLATRRGLFL